MFVESLEGALTSLEVPVLLIDGTTSAIPRDRIVPDLHCRRALCPQYRNDSHVDQYSQDGDDIEDPYPAILSVCSLELQDEDDDCELA
jgi:hypothetical protein